MLCRTAQQGYRTSQVRLGNRFYTSCRTREGIALAHAWYSQASNESDNERLKILKRLMTPDELEKARSNSVGITPRPCLLDLDGLKGLQDAELPEPPELLPPGASMTADARLQLYYNAPSRVNAKRWLCRAADSGSAEAQYRLAVLYENGSEGVAQDPARAYVWYRRSASTGGYGKPEEQAAQIYLELTTDQAAETHRGLRDWNRGQWEREPGVTELSQ